jgi:hypothetical protein
MECCARLATCGVARQRHSLIFSRAISNLFLLSDLPTHISQMKNWGRRDVDHEGFGRPSAETNVESEDQIDQRIRDN